MSYSTSALIMLAAGIGVPVLAALNAHLGKFLGSPLLAVTTLLFV
ncbi:MAG: EamA-like transporter family protein, partial [Rhodobacteraceae bacterium]|nr:EamA-like transporter family protein [Paracoccaceae bacterium]